MSVTVYTAPGCARCALTIRTITQAGLTPTVVNLATAPSVRDQLQSEGFSSLPVVKTDTGAWSGFRPDRIAQLATDKGVRP